MPDETDLRAEAPQPGQEDVPPDLAPMLQYTRPRGLTLFALVALCAAGAVVALGLFDRSNADQKLASWTATQSVPTVSVLTLASNQGDRTLLLPGSVQAFYDAPIHARISGYLKSWYLDIGMPVQAGQLLAEIDAPDLDQQLVQAKADLNTALANQKLAQSTAKRWTGLVAQDAVSHQEADEKNGDLAAKSSLVNSARANVDRLEALASFKRITAPFEGVVTSRSVDIGTLITVGGPSDRPLFTVADERKLRIYVRVPQAYSAQMKSGMTASFIVPQHPGRSFTATLATTARAISTDTGTLLVQLQTDNVDGALQPGDYAQVRFTLPAGSGIISIPASALMFRDSGMVVATVGDDNHVAIKPVTIGRDLGTTVEIASGLALADRVINNPADSLRQGDEVKISAGTPESHAESHAQN